jgi:DNA repair protein RadA/Sms
VLVGHVTKDGGIAGPRVLEHLVDVVLAVRGRQALDPAHGARGEEPLRPGRRGRLLRAARLRIVGLADPSGLFLARFGGPPVPGTAVTVVMDGRRPLPAELQALVTGKGIPSPRRAVSGLDSARVAMLLAVLEKRGGIKLSDAEVYAATVGGMRVVEPAADLALALAVASAQRDVALPSDVVVLGRDRAGGGGPPGGGVGPAAGRGGPPGVHPRASCRPTRAGRRPGIRITEVGDLGSVLSVLR